MAQPMASTSVIPQGVGAPPPPGLDPKRGKLMCIKVRMLDDTVGVFHLGHKAVGQALFDEVCRHLNLLECDYFGLEFLDCYGNHCWLDKDKPILRQITSSQSDARFYFVVKFYSPNPADLEEEYTRYLFALQIKRDLATGQFVCNDNTGALMSSYVVQSECGDYSEEDYPDHTYLSTVRFIPNQSPEFENKVMQNHRKLIGMSPSESDLALLETARRCDFYGVKFHPARDIEGTPVNLAILHLGIRVYHQLACASTFSWAKIRKMSFKRKKFLIKLHPEAYHYYKDTIEFQFETRNESKAFWKKAVEHHTFFRCSEPGTVSTGQGKLFSKGSSFRYNGRTQKQLIDYVREHHKRREPFTRPIHSSFGRASYMAGTTAAGFSSDRSLPTPLIPLRPNGNGNGDLNGHAQRIYDSSPGHSLGSPGHRDMGSPAGAQASEDDMSEGHHYINRSGVSHAGSTTISFHVPTSTPVSSPRPLPPLSPGGHATTFGASHNSARGTLATSPPVPIGNGHPLTHPQAPEHARSLVFPHTASSEDDGRTGTSWPPQPLTVHGYLSADNEDNFSEDSYHLSDQEVLPSSLERRPKSGGPRSPVPARVGVPAYPPSSPEASPKHSSILKKTEKTEMLPKFPPEDDSLYSNVRAVTSPQVPGKTAVSFGSPPPSESRVKVEPIQPPSSTFGQSGSRTLPYGPRITFPEPKLMKQDSVDSRSSAMAYDNLVYACLEPQKEKTPPPQPPPKPTTPVAQGPPPVAEKPKTYGAIGPAAGRILPSEAPVVITATKANKPVPPPKPKVHLIKPSLPGDHQGPTSPPQQKSEPKEDARLQAHKPQMPEIEVQPVDRPDIQHKFMLNGEVPYVLHMRHVTKTEDTNVTITEQRSSQPFSTFRDPDLSLKERGRQRIVTDGTEVPRLRKKSLDLVPRKRLPSPGNFSSQDHSVSPTTPESGNVLDYLMRRRSASQEARAKRAARRQEGRRKTQPVRFMVAAGESYPPETPLKSSSQPELPIDDDLDSGDEDSLESRSLHEDMDALERMASTRHSTSSLDDLGAIPPPPPPLTYETVSPPLSVYDSHRATEGLRFADESSSPKLPTTTDF